MKVNDIPVKQNANQVTDPNTQVSAEEFNCIVETVKANNVNRDFTAERMGYMVLDSNKTFAEQVTEENTIYEIRDEFDLLGQTKEIPAGCVLKFEGGSLKNGTIVGDNSVITSTSKCLEEVYVLGTWNCTGEVKWWCETSGFVETSDVNNPIDVTKVDCTRDFQYALDSDFNNLYVEGLYYITSTLNLAKPKDIVMAGYTAGTYLRQHQKDLVGKTFVFTDKDITLLRIAPELLRTDDKINFSSRVSIKGGNFDVSLCNPNNTVTYTKNCIEVDIKDNRKIWGFEFDSGVWGAYAGWGTLPGGCGIKFLTDNKSGYATMVRIKGNIEWFGKGVEINTNGSCWITDIVFSGLFNNCPTAIESNTDIYMDASVQPRTFFTDKKNGVPLLNLTGRSVVGGMVWDVSAKQVHEGVTYYSNQYAIYIGTNQEGSPTLTGNTGKIYRYGSSYIAGNAQSLAHDFTFSDKRNFEFDLHSDILEGHCLRQDGNYSVKLYDSASLESSGLKVSNGNNMFITESQDAVFSLDSYDPNDGRYIEIEVLNVNNTLSWVGFVAHANGTASDSYGFSEWEVIAENTSGSSKSVQGTTYANNFAKYTRFDLDIESYAGYTVDKIIIRLHRLSGSIRLRKVYANKYISSWISGSGPYLTKSGGKLYGPLDVPKLLIGGKELSGGGSISSSSWFVSTKKKRLCTIKTSNNPVRSNHYVLLSTTEHLKSPKFGLYEFCVYGDPGHNKLQIVKVAGNYDYEFEVYKKGSSTDYTIFIEATEDSGMANSQYRVTTCSLLSSMDGECVFASGSVDDVLAEGYSLYSAVEIKDAGATESRPEQKTVGNMYFDTTLGKPIWWNGSAWVDATGATVD